MVKPVPKPMTLSRTLKIFKKETRLRLHVSDKKKKAAIDNQREQTLIQGVLRWLTFGAQFPVGSYGKLYQWRFGAFRIIKRPGINAYLLDRPQDVTSPVFNVADLTMFNGELPFLTRIEICYMITLRT